MIKENVTYTDLNGNEQNEDLYFHLSKAELVEMELSTEGGFSAMIEKIVKSDDIPEITKVFKDIILKSYGEKSQDGKRFIKSKELSTAFSQTEAYSVLFMKLLMDVEAMTKFVNGLIPADLDVPKPKAVPAT